jgi:hypothetical protein
MSDILLIIFVLILIFALGMGYATNTEKIINIEKSNQEKSDSLVYIYQVVDSLKNQIKALKHFQEEKYPEQCRVDSIQDSYLQRLNVRTAPLLSGAQ